MSQIVEGSAMQVEDLFTPNVVMFSIPAIKVLMRKAYGTLWEYNEDVGPDADGNPQWVRRAVPVSYLGFKTRKSCVKEVAEILASKISELAEQGFIHAALAPLIGIELAREPYIGRLDKTDNTIEGETIVCVMSYLAITEAGVEYAKEKWPHLFVREGGVPLTVDFA